MPEHKTSAASGVPLVPATPDGTFSGLLVPYLPHLSLSHVFCDCGLGDYTSHGPLHDGPLADMQASWQEARTHYETLPRVGTLTAIQTDTGLYVSGTIPPHLAAHYTIIDDDMPHFAINVDLRRLTTDGYTRMHLVAALAIPAVHWEHGTTSGKDNPT